MQTPKISIIVPIYNAEKFIKRCLDSIYSQTLTDYEIILVNDGSTDNSDAICKEYAINDSRITYISKENEGAGSARNMGIEIAKGEYLAFPDVDDWFESNMYAELYELAKSKDYDVVFSGVNYYGKDSDGQLAFNGTILPAKIECNSKEKCRKNIMEFFPTTTIFDVPWNKLYKRSVAITKSVRFSGTRRCQDAMFNIDFFNAIDTAVTIEKAYYNYITNTASDVNRKFPKNYIDINIAYYSKLINILKSWGMYEGDIKRHYDTSVIISIYETMGMFENPNWNLTKKEQKKYVTDILQREDVQSFTVGADVREDATKKLNVIKNKSYSRFMLQYKIEKTKNKLRNNKFIRKAYNTIKGK